MFYTIFDYSLTKAIIDPQKAKELEKEYFINFKEDL